MKKFVKVLPIALLVLAICMTSISATAAVGATYTDGVVSVTTGTTGEVTILATRQNGALNTAPNFAAAEVQSTIVYIDQGNDATFNFAPRAGVEGDTVSVFMGKQGASSIEVANVTVAAVDRTLNLLIDGAPMAGAPTEYTAAGGALPTPTRDGYTFDGWYTNAAFTGEKATAIAANETGAKTFYARWILNATVASDAGYYAPEEGTFTEGDENVGGVISVTATFGSHITNVTAVGFYAYVDEEVLKYDISQIASVNNFYTIVYGIPAEDFDTDVIILPYVVVGGEVVDGEVVGGTVVYGTTDSYQVNDYKVGDTLKYLGTLANVESQVK